MREGGGVMTLYDEIFKLYGESFKLSQNYTLEEKTRIYWQGRADTYLKVITLMKEQVSQ